MKSLLLVLVLAALPVGGQDDALTAIGSRLERHPVTTGTFVQRSTTAALAAPLLSEGRFFVDATLGLVWQIDRPAMHRYVVHTQPGASRRKHSPMMRRIADILGAVHGGRVGELTRAFEVHGAIEDDRWRISLTPRSSRMSRVIASIEIVGDRAIERVRLTHANADAIEITFSDILHPDALPADISNAFDDAQ